MTDETPALSPSIAHILESESPLHAWTAHRLLGGYTKPPTDAQELGSALHNLILEDGSGVECVPFDDFKKDAAKKARNAARAAGKIPLALPKYETTAQAAFAIVQRIRDLGYDLSVGHSEKRLEWGEPGGVRCSGHLDWVQEDHRLILELKTTSGSAHPDVCATALLKSHGILQDAAYRNAVGFSHPNLIGRVSFVYLFAQTVPPYAVTPIELGGSMREISEGRWYRALKLWQRCLNRGLEAKHWPAYADRPVRVEAPAWALSQEMVREEMES